MPVAVDDNSEDVLGGTTDTKGMLNACSAPVVSVRCAGSPIPIIPVWKIYVILS